MAGWRAPAAEPLGARLGVRARSVLVAVVVVSAALFVGGGGLVYALQVSLEQAAEDTGRTRASEVAADLRADGLQAAAQVLAGDAGTGELVQILAPDGTLAAWSSRRVATRPMSPDRPAVGTYAVRETDDDELGRRGEWTVVATATPVGDAVYVVQVAVPVRVQRQTVQTVAAFLLGVTPLLLAGVGFAVWLLVGRALRPVEGIRTEVAAIDAARLGDRVAVPATRDEIAALATTMNVMLDRLQASHRAQRAFVSDASHELRSPLATLSTAAELAARGDEATRTRLLQTINLELERLRGLVENLMTLARADAQDLAGRREDVDLDDLVDAEVRRLRATSRHQVQSDVQPVRVLGDELRLAQALRNLVDNAERHARTTVRLTLRSRDGGAVVQVDNDGPLIEAADRQRVFERFVRLDGSRSRDAGGSGLGLAIARAGARAQGGDVLVVEAGSWCRFELRVPLAPEPLPAPAAD